MKLGLISNIISPSVAPHFLVEYGVWEYMDCIVLSSAAGIRKPSAEIFRIVEKELGLGPEELAYVGDNPVRDVEGAVDAGYGSMIPYEDAGAADREGKVPTGIPDYRIKAIRDLLDLFPPRS